MGERLKPMAPFFRRSYLAARRLAATARNAVAKPGVPVLRRWAALPGCRRGVAMVEFALVSIPLLTLVFGVISVNAIFYTMSVMQGNALYAAQLVAIGQVTSNNNGTITSGNASSSAVACSPLPATTKAEYYACNGLPSWATYTVSTTENCTTPSITVGITVGASAAAIADVLRIFSSTNVTTTAVAMKQGGCP
jgi:Flp pilus assembly protein TadG